jgi:uncharacterized protein (PEP-CTERM system associated)
MALRGFAEDGIAPLGGRRAWLLAGAALLSLLAASPRARAQDASQGSGGTSSSGGQSGAGAGAGAAPGTDQGTDQGSGPGTGLAGSGIPQVPPFAGALLPSTGADPSSPELRDRLLDAFGQNTTPPPGTSVHEPGWLFRPSITGSETFTDNDNQFGGFTIGQNHRSDDAVTQITPTIVVLGNGERFQVNLDYAPTGVIYAVNPEESQFRQAFSGDALAVAVPDLAYLDLRGNVSQNPIYGGVGAINTGLLPPSQRETLSNVSATPYLTHSFGGIGTAQAGVAYLYSATDAPSYLNQGDDVPLALPYNYGSRWLATKRAFANFTTGQDFGRFQDEISTDDSFYDGTEPMKGAHRVLLTDDVAYAINRFVSGLGEIGYENLDYPQEAYSYVGGVWSVGARVTPNAQSSLTLEYRHIDGLTTPYVYGYWQITPRIRVSGSYSAGITSFEQDQQNSLLSGSEDTTGVAASALVAAPLVNNAQFYGANQSLTRSERASASASYLAGRELVTANFNHQRSSLIGNLLGLPQSVLSRLGISQADLAAFGLLTTNTSTNNTASVSWRHDLLPDLSTDVLLGYNRNHVAATSTGIYASAQFSAGLNKVFTSTLSGRVAYIGSRALDGSGESYSGQNSDSIVVSLTKTFF